jgi:hypothetical protein
LKIAYRPFNASHSEASLQAALALSCAADSNQGESFRNKIFTAVSAKQFSQENLKISLLIETCLGLQVCRLLRDYVSKKFVFYMEYL